MTIRGVARSIWSARSTWAGCALALAVVAGCGGTGSTGSTQHVRIQVTEAGFVPPSVTVHRGQPVEVVFTRRADQTCATDVVFPALHRGYDLPLNRDVKVELSAADVTDTLRYSCSMQMLYGAIVAR